MRLTRWFAAGAVVALILVLAVAVWVDRSASVQVIVNPAPVREIRVQVDGAVATPGVFVLPSDARLIDVVDAAGGFANNVDVTTLNLAGRVGDGEHVSIPEAGAVSPPSPGSPSGAMPTGAPLDINTATAAELDELPGIGPVLAGRIVDYRDANGPFTTVDELANVQGISSRLVEELRPLVTVNDGG
ncbi:MAG TPA: ComEA family DNA-binding protein [Thermomicrobiales bacterium]|nr:ComEA family DNA-binding protein [Thermomicrobiales bacterium]